MTKQTPTSSSCPSAFLPVELKKTLAERITNPKNIKRASQKANEAQRKVMEDQPCEACGAIHPLTTNCVDDAPFVIKDQKEWEIEFDDKYKSLLESSGLVNTYPFIKIFIRQIEQEAYAKGRQDLLDELAEDQEKFLQGFAYKK